MFSLSLVGRRTYALVMCCLGLMVVQNVVAQSPSNLNQVGVSAADLAKIQESLNQMRELYEKRIHALENKVDTLQKQNTQLTQQVQTFRMQCLFG